MARIWTSGFFQKPAYIEIAKNIKVNDMKVAYVVLYVQDEKTSVDFWTQQVGMKIKKSTQADGFQINQVGFADQDFSFELVPLAFMEKHESSMNTKTPSICFHAKDLTIMRDKLIASNVTVTEISDHFGIKNFAFSDPAGNWFAVIE